jgi:hypothetical protein
LTALVSDLLEGEFSTEPNGFWLAKRPSYYVQLIKPTDWTTTIAIRTRAALLGWVERTKKEGADYEPNCFPNIHVSQNGSPASVENSKACKQQQQPTNSR